MSRPIRLLSAFMTVGAWTLLSRILGFVRDAMIAAFLGAGPVVDAFVIAFSLPNLFRRFFAEGAFNMAFIPMFSKRLEKGEDAQGFATDAMSGLAAIVLAFTLIALAAMPWLVFALASGFKGDARFDLAVDYGRITFPYIFFISLAALLSGVLNALGRFAIAAAAPIFLNFILIGAMLFAAHTGADVARTLVWAIPVAGLIQMVLVWVAASHAGIRLIPRLPRWTPELKRLAIIAGPAALAGGVVQVNLVVGRQVASYFEGAAGLLYYADRLYQLPLGLVGVAIGVVLLPDLSRRLGAGDKQGGIRAVNRATEFSMALTLPATAALIAIPLPLVAVLFQRGAFTPADAAATSVAVAIYGAGLPAFVLQKVFSPIYFAREDTRRPFNYAFVSMLVNAVLAIGLAPVIGFVAAAVGTTIAAWINLGLLWRGARRIENGFVPDARLIRALPRLLFASVLMGGVVLAASVALGQALVTPTWRYAALGLLVAIGAGFYAVAVLGLGAMKLSDLRSALRRG